jgi:hypothetical protein
MYETEAETFLSSECTMNLVATGLIEDLPSIKEWHSHFWNIVRIETVDKSSAQCARFQR